MSNASRKFSKENKKKAMEALMKQLDAVPREAAKPIEVGEYEYIFETGEIRLELIEKRIDYWYEQLAEVEGAIYFHKKNIDKLENDIEKNAETIKANDDIYKAKQIYQIIQGLKEIRAKQQ